LPEPERHLLEDIVPVRRRKNNTGNKSPQGAFTAGEVLVKCCKNSSFRAGGTVMSPGIDRSAGFLTEIFHPQEF
jgi:hypothetical protein